MLGCLLGALVAGLFGGVAGMLTGAAPDSVAHVARNALYGYLVIGLSLALGYLIVGPSTGLVNAMGTAFIGGIGGGVAGALMGYPSIGLRCIAPVDRLRWSWAKAIRLSLGGLLLGLFGGLGIGGLVFLGGGILHEAASPLTITAGNKLLNATGGILGFGFLGALIGILVVGLAGGITGGEVEAKVTPNQGIHRSFGNAVLGGGSVGLISALVGAILFGFSYEVVGTLGSMLRGLVGGMLFGLFYGGFLGSLAYGGYACLSHAAFRLVIWRNGSFPLRLVPFLDYCVERIFLRKVGGGYIFIHRLLMEHFASLHDRGAEETLARAVGQGGAAVMPAADDEDKE
jgi:hypothetical protein